MSVSITDEEMVEVMVSLGMSGEDAGLYKGLVEANMAVAEAGGALGASPPVLIEREWRYPEPEENPFGAWYVRTNLVGAAQGKLAGKSVVVKDNLLLAGVPLMNGTSILDGYIADVDAQIVTRMLNAGATIIGKSVCEAYCFSGGSHTSATGFVRNPRKPSHSAGGSSSGSAALIAAGEVDLAIGCDQGGSIRMPASFSGIVGMKPTWGLVPYSGILGMNPSIDHTGPMTATVADNALLLEVLAGKDGEDTRQIDVPDKPVAYTDALGSRDLTGICVGIVAEGFGLPSSEADVDATVRAAANRFSELGATVMEISIPAHAQAGAITFGATQAITTSMFSLDGCLIERPDSVPVSYIEHQSHWRERADELPANVKFSLISGELLRRRHGYSLVARAKQGVRQIREDYNKALTDVDVLIMPTTPMKATPLPRPDASPEEVVGLAFGPLANTSVFNNTHHPAISVPCGVADDLPIGMMLVGRHFDEALLYKLAHAFEQHLL